MAKKKELPEAPAEEQIPIEGELLAPASGAIVEFNKTEAALVGLKEKYGDPKKFDVSTLEGFAEAKAGLKELVGHRTGIESKRVDLKKPHLDRGRYIDDEAKRITVKIVELETPMAAIVKAETDRLAVIAEAEEKAEAARVTALQARLARIREVPLTSVGATLEKLRLTRTNLEAINLEEFQEFAESAKLYRESALESIALMIKAAQESEEQNKLLAEQKRITQIRANIAEITSIPSKTIGLTIDQMRNSLTYLQVGKLEWAQEFLDEAVLARANAITQVHNLIAGQEQLETMRAQLEALQPKAVVASIPNNLTVVSVGVTDEEQIALFGDEENIPVDAEYYASGEAGLLRDGPEDIAQSEETNQTVEPSIAIESPVVNESTGGQTTIGRNEIIYAVHKHCGIPIGEAALACINAFNEE